MRLKIDKQNKRPPFELAPPSRLRKLGRQHTQNAHTLTKQKNNKRKKTKAKKKTQKKEKENKPAKNTLHNEDSRKKEIAAR